MDLDIAFFFFITYIFHMQQLYTHIGIYIHKNINTYINTYGCVTVKKNPLCVNQVYFL